MKSAAERRAKVIDALERVGLSPVELFLTKYPRDLSGGQKQRVVIARAIIMGPTRPGRRRADLDARHECAGQDPAADARPQGRSSASATSTSRTTWPARSSSATGSRSCTSAGSSSSVRPRRSSTIPSTRTPRRCWLRSLIPIPSSQHPARPAQGRDPRRRRPPHGLFVPPDAVRGLRQVRLGVTRPGGHARGALAQDRRSTYRRRAAAGSPTSTIWRPASRARRWSSRRVGRAARATCDRCSTRSARGPRTPGSGPGVARSATAGDGVEVDFTEGEDPELRPADDVEVACHLY